jgi:hypothetical protein
MNGLAHPTQSDRSACPCLRGLPVPLYPWATVDLDRTSPTGPGGPFRQRSPGLNWRRPSPIPQSRTFVLLTSAFLSLFLGIPEHRARAEDGPGKVESKTHHRSLWSWQPLKAVPPPINKEAGWATNPIDAFILAKLKENHLSPTLPAPRLILLRRACLDLTGLPPTPEQIESFLQDDRPDAYTDLIERLLGSPAYGECWARHWLDVARYADTGGFEADLPYPDAWQYRDYVIRSFNSDKPFDRFIQEQVAGDELWPNDPAAVTATGLYCVGPVLQESAMVSNQLESEWLTDAADTTGAAFLGITLGCARCHNHKYDPILQKDYYSLQAFFAASDRVYPEKVREQRLKALNGLLAEKPLPEQFKHDPRCTIQTEAEAGLRLVHLAQPHEVHVLRRGDLSKPRELVGPAFPEGMVSEARNQELSNIAPSRRRATLAQWLTDPTENPLPARVIVNRVWAWHFGQGIVRTPNDFGTQGDKPTQPELLDWLTVDFVRHGWSLKHLHRLILSSSTYQMRSIASAEAVQADPDNRLLSHFPRRRMAAEVLWDSLHACAGTLNPKEFGPPIVPPLTKDELTGLFLANEKWPVTKDRAEDDRRGVYLFVRRTFAFPLFDAFDPPDLMVSCPRRMETTVPTQALTLLNSQAALEQARAFATRLCHECGQQPEPIVARAWLLAYGRPISKTEAGRATVFLDEREAALKQNGGAAPDDRSSRLARALTELCLALFNSNEFIFID